MIEGEKTMSERNASKSRPEATDITGDCGLDRHYGKIGISAVAAAVPYSSKAKRPAYVNGQVRVEDGHRRKRSVLAL